MRPYRRMGVVVVYGDLDLDIQALREKAQESAQKVTVV